MDLYTIFFGQIHVQLMLFSFDCFFLLSLSIKTPVLHANSVDLDQTPCSVASDLYLHRFSMSLKWDARINGLSNTHCG